MFIGRKAESQFLEDKYRQKDGQLIVLYGRRRVGKTETLRQFCKGKPHIFFSCRECTDKMQLKNFSEKLLRENIPARSYITEFSDWEKAFRAIMELPYGDAKKLVVIDEFPYMCKGNPSIPFQPRCVPNQRYTYSCHFQHCILSICTLSVCTPTPKSQPVHSCRW